MRQNLILLILVVGTTSIFQKISAQVYGLPVKGEHIYYYSSIGPVSNLLELDTIKMTYIYSRHTVNKIYFGQGKYEFFDNDMVYFTSTSNKKSQLGTPEGNYLLDNIFYYNKKDKKKKINGWAPTPLKDIPLEHDFYGFAQFTSGKDGYMYKAAVKNKRNKAAKFKAKSLEILKIKVPEYYEIVSENFAGPYDIMFYEEGKQIHWNQNTSDSAVIYMLPIIVHESIHNINEEGANKIMLTPKEIIKLEFSTIFETIKMIDFFEAKGVTDSIGRFTTYVGSSNSTSSLYGIRGLLDEFSAYYHGANVSFKLYKDYKAAADSFGINTMEEDLIYTYCSYYQFKLFIGGYLAYLKENIPRMYEITVNNRNIALAYAGIEKKYGHLIGEIDDVLEGGEIYEEFEMYSVEPTKKLLKQFQPCLDDLKQGLIANK
jgi:hypothetical protein